VTPMTGHQLHQTGERAAGDRDPRAREVPLRRMLERGITSRAATTTARPAGSPTRHPRRPGGCLR
jgi:hypothetical protein